MGSVPQPLIPPPLTERRPLAEIAVVLAGSALLPAHSRVLVWGMLAMAYLAGFAAMIVTAPPARVAATLTITDALTERFGLLVIIMLGETVKGVVDGLAGSPGALSITTGLVAVVIGLGAWWTYFDFAGHRRPRATPLATVQWILTHLPLAGAMT
ncbi:MAG: low temperature requirement protein A, partial [Streptomyces sp.]|nr:low temperature requirement protein A [Streptomyces sp.]